MNQTKSQTRVTNLFREALATQERHTTFCSEDAIPRNFQLNSQFMYVRVCQLLGVRIMHGGTVPLYIYTIRGYFLTFL